MENGSCVGQQYPGFRSGKSFDIGTVHEPDRIIRQPVLFSGEAKTSINTVPEIMEMIENQRHFYCICFLY